MVVIYDGSACGFEFHTVHVYRRRNSYFPHERFMDIIRYFYMQKQKLFGGDPLGRINKDDGES